MPDTDAAVAGWKARDQLLDEVEMAIGWGGRANSCLVPRLKHIGPSFC